MEFAWQVKRLWSETFNGNVEKEKYQFHGQCYFRNIKPDELKIGQKSLCLFSIYDGDEPDQKDYKSIEFKYMGLVNENNEVQS